MQRKKSFVVVLAPILFLVGISLGARGQVSARPALLPKTIELKRTMNLNMVNQANPILVKGPLPVFGPLRVIPEDLYTRQFGIMCQEEWQFEKKTHIPLRFRLGSLEACNFLEGKK